MTNTDLSEPVAEATTDSASADVTTKQGTSGPGTSPTSLPLRFILPLGIWALALGSALSLGEVLEGRLGDHSICGPWGCGPALEKLIAWHGFCLALFVAPAAYVAFSFPAKSLRWLGWLLLGTGIAVLAGIGIWVTRTWLPFVKPGEPSFLVQRYLFVVATLVNVPVIPITLAGLVLSLQWRKPVVK